jgi:hypothetical protein
MLQPFVPLRKIFVDKLISLQKYYLVSQSYQRHFDHFEETYKPGILFTDYDAAGHANMHLNTVKHDPYAAILDLRNQNHYQKIITLIEEDKYRLFWAVVAKADDLKKRLDAGYKEKIRSWIQKNTIWKIGGSDQVTTACEVRWGELFLVLRWRTEQVSIKFEEIEKH